MADPTPQPLPYRQFIRRLFLLEVCIPVLPTAPGEKFMIFERGATGYNARPSGRRYTFVHREDDELVPVAEAEKALEHLGVSTEMFWSIEDHTASKTAKTTPLPKPASPRDK